MPINWATYDLFDPGILAPPENLPRLEARRYYKHLMAKRFLRIESLNGLLKANRLELASSEQGIQTMWQGIDRLLKAAGPPICDPVSPSVIAEHPGLLNLLSRVNGFYAFESALHVYPFSGPRCNIRGAIEWNQKDLWRYEFGGMDEGMFFFAEDIFGCQFALKANGDVVSFDPESAEITFIAHGVDDWAQMVVDDFEVRTGYPLAHEWQTMHGPVSQGWRLAPIVPFVLGGEFDINNLRAVEAIDGMRLRGRLAKQIRGLSDGTRVNVRFVEDGRPELGLP